MKRNEVIDKAREEVRISISHALSHLQNLYDGLRFETSRFKLNKLDGDILVIVAKLKKIRKQK